MSRERLERCFHLCAQRAWRLACVVLGEPHGAADCVQQAFAAAARKPAAVPADDPWPWFSTVLFHEIRNHRRKRRPQPLPQEFDMQAQTPDPASQAARQETQGELRLALQTLPEAERDALTLTFISGLTQTQAAQTLDMPAKTLSSHVMRGLERLRRRLNHKEEALMSGLATLPLLIPPGGWEGALAAWKGAALGSALPGTVAVVGGTIMAKKAMVAAGIVLALCVGFGGGMLAERGATPQPELAARTPAEPDFRAGPAQTTSAADKPEFAAPRAGEDRADSHAMGPQPTFSNWLASVGAQQPTPGQGRIHGRVTGPDGEPLPGVTVSLAALYPENKGDEIDVVSRLKLDALNEGRETLEQQIRAQARTLAFLDAGRQQVRTGAEGTYEFADLGLYVYSIKAERPGYAFKVWGDPAEGRRVRPGAQIDFTARAVCRLELDVWLPDGSAPAVAQVVDSRFFPLATWFAEHPVIALELGSLTFSVHAGRLEEFLSDPISFTATPEPQRIVVPLKPSPGILCVVKVPTVALSDAPYERYQVCLQLNPPAEPPAERPRGLGLWLKSLSGLRMEANYPRQAAGRYRVHLLSDNNVEAWKDIELKSESVVVTLEPAPPDPKDYIVVRVFGPDGQPAPNAKVDADRFGQYSQLGSCNVTAMPDGTHWVERAQQPADSARPWSYGIQVRLANYGSTYVLHPPDGPGELTIRLPALATLTLQFPGASWHPERSRLHPLLNHHASPSRRYGVAPHGFKFPSAGLPGDKLEYGPMPPGKYSFTLSFLRAGSDAVEGTRIAFMEIDLEPGENTRVIEIPTLHTLTLFITNGTVKELNIERPDGSGRRWLAPESISASTKIEGITRGEWLIRNAGRAMRVNVTSDMAVQLDLRAMDCILIGQLKAGGKIEALGLRTGDKVIRVDGKENESSSDIQKQMSASYKQDATTWTVQRGGVLLDIRFSGIELLKILQAPVEEREYLRDRHSLRD